MGSEKGTPLWKALLFKRRLPGRYQNFIKNLPFKILKITKQDINYFYDEKFATDWRRNKKFSGDLCDFILKEFNPKSVIDFGCGTGDILAPFEKRGIEILGIDGSKANKKYSRIHKDNFLLFDLRKKCTCQKKYDLCICLEVAEHIEEAYSDVLIKNLVSSSSTIVFTAAPPGQGGVDHYNEKPFAWWIQKFKEHGFKFDEQCTVRLKQQWARIPDIYPFYVDNLMIFRKEHPT